MQPSSYTRAEEVCLTGSAVCVVAVCPWLLHKPESEHTDTVNKRDVPVADGRVYSTIDQGRECTGIVWTRVHTNTVSQESDVMTMGCVGSNSEINAGPWPDVTN